MDGRCAATESFTLTVDQPPVFMAASPPLTVVAGHSYSYDFAASGFRTSSYNLASGAPSWLSIDPTTGAVSVTVATDISSFTYSVTASNGVGSPATVGPFTVTVVPVVTHAEPAAARQGLVSQRPRGTTWDTIGHCAVQRLFSHG